MSLIKSYIKKYIKDYIVTSISGYDEGSSPIELSLTSSAEIDAFLTKYTGSFTRASTMYVPDFEGIYKESPINQYALDGARKVTNLCLYNQDISVIGWGKNDVTITGTNTFQATARYGLIRQYIDTIAGHTYGISFTASVEAGGTATGYSIYHAGSETGTTTVIPVITETPKQYYVEVLGEGDSGQIAIGFEDTNISNWSKIIITDFLLEDRTGISCGVSDNSGIPTTTAASTKYYNTERNMTSIFGIVYQKVIGNYPKGGVAIGDSQTNDAESYSYYLDAVIDSTVTNKGIDGNTSTQIEARFLADADPANQSFVVIQGFINDFLHAGTNPNTTTQANVLSMVSMCTTNGAEPIFINMSPWKGDASWTEDRQAWVEEYNNWLAAYCNTNGYKLIDVYSLLADPNDPETLYSIYRDSPTLYLHMNDRADVIVANEIIAYLRTTATNTDIETDLANTILMAFWPTTENVIGSAQYRDFTHVDWNVTDCSITAGAVTLIDGTNVSDKNTLIASGANATIILDPYTSASGKHAGGCFIKRKTGTGDIEVTIDGGTTWVDVTAQVDADTNWHLCQTTLPTVTDPEFGVRLVTSGDAVYLDWAQMDDGYSKVSVYPIAGGATLEPQDFHFANSSLINDAEGSVYVEAQLLPDDLPLISGSLVYPVLGFNTINNRISSWDGSNFVAINNAWSNFSKLVSYWLGVNKQLSSNGASSSAGDYDGSWSATDIYIGSSDGSAGQVNGGISKIIFDPEPHDATYWEGVTTP